jgi:PHD/YefM family antitoxin component YafN of YafNO toxin-antitoxin module
MTRTTDDLFLESLEETLAILSDPEAMRGITEGREAIRGGDSILGVEPIRALRPAWA